MGKEEACPGLEQVAGAGCLSDLLFHSPTTWQQRPILRRRVGEGEWKGLNRITVQQRVLRLAAWLEAEGVKPGDRIGILGHNSIEWFISDFATLRLGAVTVPAYFTDPAESVEYVFNDAGCRLILVEPGEQQEKVKGLDIRHIPFSGAGVSVDSISRDERWDDGPKAALPDRNMLATLIYTSGTTGNPKGVMLTHGNLLSDVAAGLGGVAIFPEDLFLSFLPVSHAFERTVGHFLVVASGAEIAYAEDVTTLMRDMPEVKPTVMISVPRLYEKIYAGVHAKMEASVLKKLLFDRAQALGMERFELRQQGRDLAGMKARLWGVLDHLVNSKLREKMGGRLRLFISGGAALSPAIARFLLAADITVLPGYGLTETSPVLSVNTFERIKPESVGRALPGVETRLAEDGELLVRGPMVMQGYWNRPEATGEVLEKDGWLHTGDIVEIDSEGFIRIVDRKKEIMVLSNGENVPPAIIEQHLVQDTAILQALVVAENRPYVVALIVPDMDGLTLAWKKEHGSALPDDWRTNAVMHRWMLERMRFDEHDLPSYMQVKKFTFIDDEWTQTNGMLTPTLKVKRRMICELHAAEIEQLFAEDDD
ncbi:MAG: long-chain fatty acid--CoA ligase [Mariprofundaceae bacterium]|nr:long-chain fatty acid--CoA ligase [Mariprofundaceae bacterium]